MCSITMIPCLSPSPPICCVGATVRPSPALACHLVSGRAKNDKTTPPFFPQVPIQHECMKNSNLAKVYGQKNLHRDASEKKDPITSLFNPPLRRRLNSAPAALVHHHNA